MVKASTEGLTGRRLSHFRVMRKVGEGGMGVVYQARDVHLQRDVALKVLAPGLIANPDSRKRFRREALASSRLHHPAIATVFEFNTGDGVDFLAMEFIQGVTLASRLEKGPIPRIQALEVGLQIAEALEFAHAHGVVHRDLKPGNVMVTANGRVKVLDFGIARATARSATAHAPKRRTRPSIAHRPGDSEAMGTPGYMSPEQAMGKPQNHRTDIFSFGCVLFECLAGTFAFGDGAAEELIEAVLTKDPLWGALPAGLPRPVKDLLDACLRKDPKKRLADIHAARVALEEILGAGRRHAGERRPARPIAPGLPWQGTTFIGRDAELAKCRRLLADARLLTLTGFGGSGKTRLALRLAEDLAPDYPDGVWFADLGPQKESSRVVQTVATAAGVREGPAGSLLETLVKAAAERAALLVLDNCEHQLAPCAELARALLDGGSRLTILATSREALPIPEGATFAVPPLATPRAEGTVSARSLASTESVRLFIERAARAKPGFDLTDENAPAVAEICRRLDGIPLAIELAASRMAVLSVEDIRSKLNQRFRLLGTESTDAPARHRTLHAAISWSYEQLTPEEQRLFRSLSVFQGGWTFDAAVAVGGGGQDEFTTLDQFTHLLEKSLFAVGASEDGATRYRYLETIEAFARQQAEAAGELESARERHLEYFLALVEEANPKLTGPEQGPWLARIETEHENVLAALAHCGESTERFAQGLRLTAGLRRFWVSRGHFAVGARAIETALGRDRSSTPTIARAETLVGGSAIAFHVNDWPKGSKYAEDAIELFTVLRDNLGLADALIARGNHALGQADYDGARSFYDRALSHFREAGQRRGMGVALTNAGRAAELQGDLAAAARLYDEGLANLRDVGDLSSTSLRLSSLGHLLLKLGDLEGARERLLECLTLILELREKRAGEFALERSAALLAAMDRPYEGAVICAAAEALSQTMGSPLTPRERNERDELISKLRDALGKEFEAAWGEGRALDFESSVESASGALGGKGSASRTTTARKTPPTRRTASTVFLLQDIRAGNPEATARIVKRYLPILRTWAHGLLPSRARQYSDTDDLVQVALIRGLRQANTFEHRHTGSFLAYMKQILRNQLRDEIRRPGAKLEFVEPPDELQDSGGSPIDDLIEKESIEAYQAALATLSQTDRDGIIMRLEMGLSFREIAEVLGRPSEEAARVGVRRALERLRKQLPGLKSTEL